MSEKDTILFQLQTPVVLEWHIIQAHEETTKQILQNAKYVSYFLLICFFVSLYHFYTAVRHWIISNDRLAKLMELTEEELPRD